MCGPPDVPGPRSAADEAAIRQAEIDAQIQLAQEEARLAEEARQRQIDFEAAERDRLQGEFDTNVNTAYNQALSNAQNQFNQRGFDQQILDALNPRLTSELDRVRSTIPNRDPSPGNYFSNTIADTVMDDYRDQQVRSHNQAIDRFADTGFADNLWANTADDAILNSIISENYTPAAQQINNAFRRGSLNQQGFDTAMRDLDSQRTAATSNLQNVGQGVLSGFRTDLQDIGSQARTSANNFQLGDTFNPNTYQTQIDNMFADQQGRLEGSVRQAVGNDPLFDINSIIQGAGARQGVTSGNAPLLDNFYEAENQRRRGTRRGLGTQGVF